MGARKATAILTTSGLRLLQIERALRSGRVKSMAELMSTTGASLATVKRDLVAMRDELGAPVIWDGTEHGYRFAKPWPSVLAVGLYEQGFA